MGQYRGPLKGHLNVLKHRSDVIHNRQPKSNRIGSDSDNDPAMID